MVNSVMPLERALLAQTYLVQDTLSLADIVIALDIKPMVRTNHYISILIMFHAVLVGFICTLCQTSGTPANFTPAKTHPHQHSWLLHIHISDRLSFHSFFCIYITGS